MLLTLKLENWKSFGAGERNVLRFGPLTLLVGPNASGKSNALDALRFLQGAALDFPLGDVLRGRWEGQREVWPPIRGGVAEAAHFGADDFTLFTKWTRATHEVTVASSREVHVTAERLLGGELY